MGLRHRSRIDPVRVRVLRYRPSGRPWCVPGVRHPPRGGAACTRVLDRASVVRLARDHGPMVYVAVTRVGEARALHAGAGALAPVNPELSLYGGPRWSPGEAPAADLTLALSWPVDFSGARGSRRALAEDRNAGRGSRRPGGAMGHRGGSPGPVGPCAGRRGACPARGTSENSWTRRRSSRRRIRRDAGSVGDGAVALARCSCGEHRPRPCGRGRPGKPSRRSCGDAGDPIRESGHALRRASHGRPGFPRHASQRSPTGRPVRAARLIQAAQTEVTLQDRQGTPVPRVTLAGGRDVEYFTHIGVDLPLPVYQRNQGGERLRSRGQRPPPPSARGQSLAEADLCAAYATWQGARQALDALDAATAP